MSDDTIRRGGFMAVIEQDDMAENPRRGGHRDNMSEMVCFHRRYELGDEGHGYTFNGWAELEKQIMKEKRPIVIKPLYMYDHSGLTISTSPYSCPWDSGQIGFVYVRRGHKELRGTIEQRKAQAERIIEGEVNEYDQYLRGDVYNVRICRDEDGEEGEQVDSCCGFFGYEYAKEEAERMLSETIENEKKTEKVA